MSILDSCFARFGVTLSPEELMSRESVRASSIGSAGLSAVTRRYGSWLSTTKRHDEF